MSRGRRYREVSGVGLTWHWRLNRLVHRMSAPHPMSHQQSSPCRDGYSLWISIELDLYQANELELFVSA